MRAGVAAAAVWLSPALEPGDDAVASWAARTLAGLGAGADALCVATLDSGARESVHFWRESRAELAFANPRAFPWTLANSPTGRIAQELGVRGPTFTLVGRAEALHAALAHALDELESGRAGRVLVAALDGVTTETTRLAALVLTADEDAELARVSTLARPAEGAVGGATASETLAAAIERLGAGEAAAVGSDRDGWFELRPSEPDGGVRNGVLRPAARVRSG